MIDERLKKQIEFIIEIDKLKHITRQNLIADGSREENDVEHSWHLAVMAILLSEYAKEKDLDVLKTVKMVLIHDMVEIDAGDTFCYDTVGYLDKGDRERRAAERLFGILPEDQAEEFRRLWEEFEERKTPEAKFAAALDRIQPLLNNYLTQGHTWNKHTVTSDRVMERSRPIKEAAPVLWDFVYELIEESIEKGYLKRP